MTAYAAHRQGQGASPATARRELATFGKLLRIAYKNNKLARLPLIEKPVEGPPRGGFFEHEQVAAICRYFRRHRPNLEVAVTIASRSAGA